MKHRLHALRPTSTDNGIDRRNTVVIQWLLAIIGIAAPMIWSLRWLTTGIDGHDTLRVKLHLTAAALAWLCIFVVRRGRFRMAVVMFLGGILGLIAVSYASFGLEYQREGQVLHTLPIILAGLTLGQRALWTTFALTVLGVVLGVRHDLLSATSDHWSSPLISGTACVLCFLIIAALLDRTVAALRESLIAANLRAGQLQVAKHRLEEEIEERERTWGQLIHAQKMETVGRMSAGIAHDFNTILGIILGYARTRDREHDPAALAQALAGIEAAVHRAAAVTRKLLHYNRRDVSQVTVFSARDTIESLYPMLRQLFDERRSVSVDLPDEPLPVHLDQGQFELAVLNIAANARDALDDGGALRITASRVYNEAAGRRAEVAVVFQDNGSGMPPEVARRVFEPFFTTKAAGVGTGLGLAVVHSIIHTAGGSVSVDSEPGRGTTLTLLLPLADWPSEPSTAPAEGKLSVILVDDDDDLRALLARALRRGECEVFETASGAVALQRLLSAGAPDILVTDIHINDIDGITLIQETGVLYPDLPVIVISACPGASADTLPAAHYLPKPFPPDRLLAAVRTHVKTSERTPHA